MTRSKPPGSCRNAQLGKISDVLDPAAEHEASETLVEHTLRKLSDEPDLLYAKRERPADLENAEATARLVEGLRPAQKVRLAAVNPTARKLLLAERPPVLPPDAHGPIVGALLSRSLELSSSLREVKNAISEDRQLIASRPEYLHDGDLVDLQANVVAQLRAWEPWAIKASRSLEQLTHSATPAFLAAILAHDSTQRKAIAEKLRPLADPSVSAAQKQKGVIEMAEQINAVIRSLKPLWDGARPCESRSDTIGALRFLSDVLALLSRASFGMGDVERSSENGLAMTDRMNEILKKAGGELQDPARAQLIADSQRRIADLRGEDDHIHVRGIVVDILANVVGFHRYGASTLIGEVSQSFRRDLERCDLRLQVIQALRHTHQVMLAAQQALMPQVDSGLLSQTIAQSEHLLVSLGDASQVAKLSLQKIKQSNQKFILDCSNSFSRAR